MSAQAKLEPQTKRQVVPIRVGIFGGQGSGKSTTALMLALALSVEHHNRAPIFVTDTEPGWQFYKRIFATEGVELIQRTTPTFKAMLGDLREVEKAGACVWAVDVLTVIWNELQDAFKKKNGGRIPINVWGDIRALWNEYATLYRNLGAHAFALGRLGNVMEDVEDENDPGRTKLVKTGTQFKAGGSESFGYEPDLLLELSIERKAKKKAGVRHEGEGRMVHRCDVLKDRTWALNGRVFRWSDKPKYEKGGYRTVWDSIRPHFEIVQDIMSPVKIQTGQSTTGMIADNGSSEFYARRERRDILVAEFNASIELLWGGTSQAAKHTRIQVFEKIFGFKSKEAAEAASLATIERGVKIIQSFERRCKEHPELRDKEVPDLLIELDADIAGYEMLKEQEEAELSMLV